VPSCSILDKNIRIREDATIGYDLEADRARGWHVTGTGIVVIGRGYSSVPMAVMVARVRSRVVAKVSLLAVVATDNSKGFDRISHRYFSGRECSRAAS
jgi:hypothetical protein